MLGAGAGLQSESNGRVGLERRLLARELDPDGVVGTEVLLQLQIMCQKFLFLSKDETGRTL